MKIDSITPSGMHIEGKIVNGKKEGVWVISNDTSRIVRKYKEGYKVKERIFINDSLIFEFNK